MSCQLYAICKRIDDYLNCICFTLIVTIIITAIGLFGSMLKRTKYFGLYVLGGSVVSLILLTLVPVSIYISKSRCKMRDESQGRSSKSLPLKEVVIHGRVKGSERVGDEEPSPKEGGDSSFGASPCYLSDGAASGRFGDIEQDMTLPPYDWRQFIKPREYNKWGETGIYTISEGSSVSNDEPPFLDIAMNSVYIASKSLFTNEYYNSPP